MSKTDKIKMYISESKIICNVGTCCAVAAILVVYLSPTVVVQI